LIDSEQVAVSETESDSKTIKYGHEEIPADHSDPMLRVLHRIIRVAVRCLAVLMVLVIIWGVFDVVYVLAVKLMEPPFLLLDLNDIFATLGAFLAVLIAIEVFINITLYLRSDVMPVKLVVATALMAIARKIIVLDFKELGPAYIFAIAAVVLGVGITYWLVSRESGDTTSRGHEHLRP
jgi:uncharacterized membrane protein (DUF373 family)